MDSTYRDTIIECLKYLTEVRENFFSKIINIEMAGDLKEINEVFSIGDVFQFELAHLETSNDSNVQRFTGLFKLLDKTIDTTMNLNSISDEDIEGHDVATE